MIESESRMVLRFLWFLIRFPFILISVLWRKKRKRELLEPISEISRFFFQAKLTSALMFALIFVFFYEVFFMTSSQIKDLVFRPEYLLQLNFKPMIFSWFLHGSWYHLMSNLLFLFIFGRVVEDKFGIIKMLLIYFGSAIISDLISSAFGFGGIGASGAIAGLISTAILIKPFYLTYLILGIPIPIIILGWFGILLDLLGILVPTGTNINHFAHLGGYLSISILIFIFNRREKHELYRGLIINILFVALMVYLFRELIF